MAELLSLEVLNCNVFNLSTVVFAKPLFSPSLDIAAITASSVRLLENNFVTFMVAVIEAIEANNAGRIHPTVVAFNN
jgi:hypothetical protein